MYKNQKIKIKDHYQYFLLRENSQLPIMFPFLYGIFKLRNKSLSIQKQSMKGILNWYVYWSTKKEECFDIAFYNSGYDLEIVYKELEGFFLFLTTNNQTSKLSINTIHLYLMHLKAFFQFLGMRYTCVKYKPQNKNMDFNVQFLRIQNRLNVCFKYNEFNTSFLGKNWNLPLTKIPEDVLKKISDLIRPSTSLNINTYNPWKSKEVQLRNFIMINLLINYGLRSGELLSLTLHSIKPNLSGKGYSLIITNLDEQDDRSSKPLIKTAGSHRNIYLSSFDYNMISLYLDQVRLKQATKHSILFTSLNNKALSYEQLRRIVSIISTKIQLLYPDQPDFQDLNLTPHIFRHTWAANYLKYLIEVEKQDMEFAKDNLRLMGGWSMTSEIPVYYANSYISNKANKINQNRVMKED